MAQKVFRIEAFHRPVDAPVPVAEPDSLRTSEIIGEIRALRALMEPQTHLSQNLVDLFRKEMGDAAQMKAELEAIQDAIEQTKLEIATVHTTGFQGTQMKRVTGELDAIVQGTLDATDTILTAAESIDRDAYLLEASCKSKTERQAAAEIKEQVVRIFEACNFQDLTGQRITKVVNTLKFIEDRIMRMVEIWGGLESLQSLPVETIAAAEGDAALLNGPRLVVDAGHASQDDIDALFG